jgi:HrpA-like RNA helicase
MNNEMEQLYCSTGICDVNGENDNPLNGQKYSDTYKNLAQIWSKLPCYDSRDKFLELLKNKNVVLVAAATGSGKTVLVPKFALHYLDYKGKIIVTLPKKNITKSAAKFASETLDVELGEYVGFQFRGENMKSKKTKLLYSTDGSVISMFKMDPLIMEYDIIIIDEAHERKIQIDLLLYLMKNAVEKRADTDKPLKLIIMSATIDETLFEKYYEKLKFAYIYLAGKAHLPIDSIFLEKSIMNEKDGYVEKGKEIINKIVKTSKEGDIIFFVTTISECEKISVELSETHKNAFCMALYSGFPIELEQYISNQEKYKELNKNYTRRIFVSTNVAESSLTIDGIIYVVDSGLEISVKYNPDKQINEMKKGLITKAQIKQRKGRTGRTVAGYCYHLYTPEEYEETRDYPESEIMKTDLKNVCLSLLKMYPELTVEKLKKLFNDFIDPPYKNYIKDGIKYSIDLGMIDDKTEQLSKIGNLVVDSRLDINDGITLLYAFNIGRTVFKKTLIIIIASSFIKKSINDFFYEDVDKNGVKKIYKELLNKCDNSEHVLIYKLFEYAKTNETYSVFNKNLIKKISMQYKKQINKLYDLYKLDKIELKTKGKTENEQIIMAFNYGYKMNKAKNKNNDFYYNKIKCDLSKAKFKYDKYKSIIFYSNVYYRKLNISIISPYLL